MAPAVTTLPRHVRVVGRLSSTDHKHIAANTAVTAFGFFVLGGILALLMRAELAAPGLQLMGDETYNELFTIHGSTMFYLFASPMAMAVGLYLVPLQIGTTNVIWPRIALLGFWLLVGAGVLMYTGFLLKNGAGKSGWFAFDPLSDDVGTPGTGQDLWTLAVILAGASGICQASSLLATIVRRRAPGMTMMRMPVFTWGETVSCLMVVTAYPAVLVAMTLLYADRNGAHIYQNPGGPILYQHLFWFFGHPVVYVVFFPFLGSIAEAIATNAGKRFFGYPFMVASLLIFSALSMAVWGHHMFTTSAVQNRYFSLTSTAIMVVAGIEYFDSLGTMWKGRIVFRTSMLFAIGFLILFLIGGLTGIFVASPVLDYHVHDTYFIVAHFHYTLVGGSVMGLFAGIYHWWPKVTGRLLDERLGKLNFWTLALGTLVTFIPMFFLGSEGMVRRVANYPADRGWETLNTISTIGAFIIAFSVLVFLVNAARSLRLGALAGDDPWDAHTLEWATSSPPPPHNFDGLPPIRSYAPLLDVKLQAEAEEEARAAARAPRAGEAAP
ncbi:MAG TPA: cbb3-type cytochrome c oxidase subunit I [Baekduia sp.]|nr:cbb3-type cytochrome c oxidase subunit I [Baekduia sp.]